MQNKKHNLKTICASSGDHTYENGKKIESCWNLVTFDIDLDPSTSILVYLVRYYGFLRPKAQQ